MQLKLPNLIVDANNLEHLEEKEAYFEMTIPRQFSKDDFNALQVLAVAVATGGAALSIWQIGLFCILGKAVNSMWILINAL